MTIALMRVKLHLRSCVYASVMVSVLLVAAASRPASADPVSALASLTSGLPLPRFVSLKGEWINVRSGPGLQYPIVWVFRRKGLPVEVLRDYQGWREVRDVDGSTGWIYGTMLSGTRTALIVPWERSRAQTAPVAMRSARSAEAEVVAYLEPGILAAVRDCDGQWCRISVQTFSGFVPQSGLWGVYQGEALK